MEQDCDLLGGFNGDGDQCAIGVEELVDLLGHKGSLGKADRNYPQGPRVMSGGRNRLAGIRSSTKGFP